jgi:hypothetical protein
MVFSPTILSTDRVFYGFLLVAAVLNILLLPFPPSVILPSIVLFAVRIMELNDLKALQSISKVKARTVELEPRIIMTRSQTAAMKRAKNLNEEIRLKDS